MPILRKKFCRICRGSDNRHHIPVFNHKFTIRDRHLIAALNTADQDIAAELAVNIHDRKPVQLKLRFYLKFQKLYLSLGKWIDLDR